METPRLIESTYLFRGAAPADLSALSGIAEQKTVFPGQAVYDVEQQSDALFIVEMGTVDIACVPIGAALTATDRERTELIRIPFDKLTRLLEERPALALVFYRNACTFLAKHVKELGAERDRRYF